LDDATDFGFFEEQARLTAVAVHAVDHQFFELLEEGVSEVVTGVGSAGMLQILVGDGVIADLFPEELVGGGGRRGSRGRPWRG
jgi:hypothetical protein